MILGKRTGVVAIGLTGIVLVASRGWAAQVFALDSVKGLQPHRVTVEAGTSGPEGGAGDVARGGGRGDANGFGRRYCDAAGECFS